MTITVSPILSVLVSALMETLLYGVNVAFFFIAMYLLRGKVGTSTSRPLIFALILLFLSLTGHVAVQWRRLLDAFYYAQTKEEAFAYFLSLSEITNVVKQYFGVFITLFQDIIIVWRLYAVWGRNLYICIVPVGMLLGTFGAGIATSYMQSRAMGSDSIFMKKISQFGLAYDIITLATNLLVTILIAGRVWFATRDLGILGTHHQKPLWRAITIIVESAAFTAFMQIVHLAFYAQKFPGTYFLEDSTLQIMGIVPTAIVIAVKLMGNEQDAMYGMGTGPLTTLKFRNGRPVDTIQLGGNEQSGTDRSPGTVDSVYDEQHAPKKEASAVSFPSDSSAV